MVTNTSKLRLTTALAVLYACISQAGYTSPQHSKDALEAGFINPPASAKPHTWWHWMNGNISKAGITADLEAMKRVGIGGAQIFNVDVGIPDGATPMMSAQWSDAIQHAIKEAHRLGLDLCIHNGAGWSSSGGPWIKPEQGMQFLTWSETVFKGPGAFDGTLPIPQMKQGLYRDIAVYAFKKPAAEASGTATLRIEGIRAKAAFERGDRLTPSDTLVPNDANLTSRADAVLITDNVSTSGAIHWNAPAGDWVLIRMGYTPTGEVNHPAPASGLGLEVDKLDRSALDTHWAGMMGPIVKGAGPLAGATLNNCLIDSYEVGTQNWSPGFRKEFQKRRGYDPLPYLPIVSGRIIESVEVSERFLWDLRRTICDLFADNYYGYLAEICHKNGLMFSTEPYGNGEFDNLQIGGTADIPMGEFWVGNGAIETTKLAASAGHIYGKPIIGAESFTADTPHARWTIDPYAMKALGDRVFSLGVNRYIFHRYAHQPWLDLKPGMTMGPWGTNFERTITWWDQGSAWLRYIARCQHLLQSGQFVADVAYFTGDEGPNDLPMLKGTVVPEGNDYDGVDRVTLQKLTVRNHWLELPSGMRYKTLVLPQSRWMTVESLRKIRDLVSEGATVIGPGPQKSPSLQGYPGCDAEVSKLAEEVWGANRTYEEGAHAFGSGKALWGIDVLKLVKSVIGAPDCDLVAGRPHSMVWIHRAVAQQNSDLYFVSNQRYQSQTFTIDFRTTGLQPELWNPQTGTVRKAAEWLDNGKRTRITLRLGPAESTFVVFRSKSPASKHILKSEFTGANSAVISKPELSIVSARYEAVDGAGAADVKEKIVQLLKSGATEIEATNTNFGDPASLHVKQLHVVYLRGKEKIDKTVGENETLQLVEDGSDTARPEFELTTLKDGVTLYEWSAGRLAAQLSDGTKLKIETSLPKRQPVTGPWRVTFPPGLGAPASAEFSQLISWPDASIAGIKYFSGTANYTTNLVAPASLFNPGRHVYLDLGTVKNFAEVRLNGHEYGVMWSPPYRLDVTGVIHSGANILEVRVTNLWPNRIIGDEQLPADVEWNGEVIKRWPDWLLQGRPRPPSDRITFTTWRVFSKDSPLYPAGLIGPVELWSVKTQELLKH